MIEFMLWFISCFICGFGYTYMYYKLNSIEFKFRISVVVTFLFGVVALTLLKFYNVGALSSLSYFIFYPLLFYIIKHLRFKKLFFYVFVIWLIGVLLDFSSMLVVSILHYVFNMDVESMLCLLILSTYVSMMLILFSNIKLTLKLVNSFYKIIDKIKYIDFMLIIFTIFIFIVGMILATNMHHISIGVMGSILAILTVFIFVLLLRSKYSEIENGIFVDILRKNNDFYINMDKEQNIFKHNLISKLLSVESVSNRKARLLIQDLIKEFNSNIDYSQKIKDIPYGLDGIINEKIYSFSDELEIKVDNKIEVDIFDVLKPRRYNVLVEKLSLILDNAIEASLTSVDKILVINLYEEDNEIIIEVKNTFGGNMDIDNLGKVNYSSKGKKRGFGLYSALRNNEVNLKVKVIQNMFVARLSVTKNLNID